MLKDKRLYVVIGVISLILVTCNILRIMNVTITHDEALSYQLFITKPYIDIINNYHPTANNHFLNSVLSRLCINTFGDTLFFLRLPNLLAHIIYMIFSFLVVKNMFKDFWWICCSFLLLQLNPFMFDFWGLCRGYGLCLALMMGSGYFLMLYLQQHKSASIFFSMLLLSGGVYANLSLLNYAMGLLGLVGGYLIIKRDALLTLRAIAIILLNATGIFLLIAGPVKVLKEKKELFYGGDDFIHDTVGSLIRESFYLDEESKLIYPVAILVVIAVLLSGLYLVVKMAREKERDLTGPALWLLLIIPAVSTVGQYHILETKYLIDRTALFFYPLFILLAVYTLYSLSKKSLAVKRIILFPVTVLFLANFVVNLNFSSTRIWDFDSHTPWLMERMVQLKKNDGKIKIYLDWLFTPSLRYYSEREHPGKFGYLEGHMEVAYEKLEYDFYLIRQWEVHKVPDIYVVDTVLSGGKYYLYQRKQWD